MSELKRFSDRLFLSRVPVCFGLAAAAAFSIAAAQEAPRSQTELTRQSIRDQVKVLRQQKMEAMPYLDRGYIRSSIRPEMIRGKTAFLQSPRKNLQDVIRRAIGAHTPAQAARERISLARRRIWAALRGLFPETKFEFNERDGRLSGDPFNSLNYKFSFRQPVFRGGLLWNRLLQEKEGLEAAEKEYIDVVEDLVKEVSTAYLEYSRAKQAVADQGGILESIKRYSEISEKKFKEQIISEIEHLNVQSLSSQVRYDHETSKQELELAKLELQRYLDLEISEEFSVADMYRIDELLTQEKTAEAARPPAEKKPGAFEGAPAAASLEELVDLAYRHRSELQVEAAKLQSARLEERIKWGEMMPRADIVLEFGKLGEAFDANSTDPALNEEFRLLLELHWNAAGNKVGYTFERDKRAPSVSQFLQGTGSFTRRHTLTAGLFDGLQEIAEAKEAEVARLDQVIELEKAEKEVIHDVKVAYFDYQKYKIQVESTLQRLDYRRRLADLNRHRLEKNEIQISEYLQALIDLMQETTSLHKALADYYTAKVKLNHAVGIRNYLAIEESRGRQS